MNSRQIIYLDNAATSYPKPPSVLREVERCLRDYCGNPGRSGHVLSLEASDAIYTARTRVASLIGADKPENVIFTQNATYALHIALESRLRAGDHVLISDLSHNSVYRPVYHAAQNGRITYSVFSHFPDPLAAYKAEIQRKKPTVCICTHVGNVTGVRLPIEEIGAICANEGIYFIVDASQSMGHRPVSLKEIPCDVLCAAGHKGLFGIQGSAFLYLKSADGLKEVFHGGSGSESASPLMPSYLPDRYEAGTLPTPAIVSLSEGIRFLQYIGVQSVCEKEAELSSTLRTELQNMKRVALTESGGGIVAFSVQNICSEEICESLSDRLICVRGGLHCAPLTHRALGTEKTGLVRVSFGWFNTQRDIKLLVDALYDIIKNRS